MVDSVSLVIFILEGLLIITLLFSVFKFVKVYRDRYKLKVKTPKLRGKSVLRDETRFGTAIVTGYQPVGNGMDAAYLELLSSDGTLFKQQYFINELYPDNPFQAIAGIDRAIWRVRGRHYKDKDSDNDKIESENKFKDLQEKIIKTKTDAAIKANEAALIPDKVDELIKDISKPKEQVRVLK